MSYFWRNRIIKISIFLSLMLIVVSSILQYSINQQEKRIFSAQYSELYADYDTGTLYIRGTIVPEMFDRMLVINFDNIHTVDLHSVGGDYMTSVVLSEWIYINNWNTYIDTGNFCFSGCTVLFQAGKNRTAHYTSLLMYHYPSTTEFTSIDDFEKDELTNYMLGQQMFDLMEIYGLSTEFRDTVDRWKNLYMSAEESMTYNIVQNLKIESWSFEWLEYQISQIY